MRSLLLSLVITAVCAASASASTLVDFRGSYVIPNGNYRMVVSGTGATALTMGKQHRAFRLSRATLRRVRSEVRAADFAHLKPVYRRTGSGPPPAGAGPQTVIHSGHRVTVNPGATAPKRLRTLLDDLDQIFEHHKPRGA
jgi:hypothetical protein